MRLSRPLTALLATAAAAASVVGISLATNSAQAAPSPTAVAAKPLPPRVFAPYFEAWTGENPATLSAASGAKYLTMAFLQTASPGSCTALWNGDTSMPIGQATFGAQIKQIQAAGGDVIPSFGGYTADTTGTELADSCTDVNKIAAEYQRLITTYDISRIDLDIEIDALDNTAGVDRRNKAVKLTKDWAKANGRQIQFSYTLPTTTTGLAQNGVALLRNAVQNNAEVDVVNIMTFDYYDNAGTHNMAEDTKTAAQGLVNTLAQLYPAKTQAQLWGMVGVTEMIGVDDFGPAETFTTANAVTVYNWALQKGINTLSFWALQRDNGNCPGGAARDDCSGIAQDLYYFSKTFAPFTGGTQNPSDDFSLSVNPSAVSLDPGKTATSTVSTAVTTGAAQTVTLSAGSAQGGVSAAVNPGSVTSGGSATVTFTANANATPGTYQFTVTGSAASGSHSATVAVTVNGTQPANDFSLAVNPSTVTVDRGKTATATLNTTAIGTAQTITLSATKPQSGVSVTLNPTSVTAGNNATITVTALAGATPGNYEFWIGGSAASGKHSTSFTVTVNTGTPPTGPIVNGDFETGSLAPWTALSGTSVVGSGAHGGTYALSVAATNSSTGEASQALTLQPNTAYTLRAWVKGTYAFIGVRGGATGSTWASPADWQEVSLPFTTGASGAVTVYVHGWYGLGTVFADDVTVSPGSVARAITKRR
ncbi:glycosyl hydrolase family 18 protein [Actinokineospora diospyrosa]|uniref:Carbohydrate binding domain-containing protein n=1 Tax=Actinokineospora diospyrosa TaxID=103728 RepID=A0ABT1IAZ6_9PSEU|nr:glycosyl hydrolase family 18 protein [Actinokineospora diospyrosa]MCP2269818.1 Carbohydrate binding domain-containing protein [Actinokineospora diospyrosa]